MLTNLHEVRREALMKKVSDGSAPLELKRKTWRIARMEDEQNKLKEENTELRKTILKLRTIHQMRDIATRATYEKRLRKLTAESAGVHKDLWGNKEDNEKKELLLRRELLTANTHLTAANMELDQLRKDLELQNKNKAALVQWKVSKSQQLTELEGKVKKYERWSSVDVDKLLAELGRKDNEIRNLSSLESRAQRQADLNDSNRLREMKRLKQALAQERKLKEQALVALDVARGAKSHPLDIYDSGEAAGMDGEDQTPTDMYVESLREDLSAALRENDIMRGVLQELGLNPPRVVRPPSAMGNPPMGSTRPLSSARGAATGHTPRPPSSHTQRSLGARTTVASTPR